ncbi:MAG TPA: ABC transporter permease [Thermoanaerobaculia bacterium]|nr:ABC transporter permease [Thermoanaerobaculia bacterium]
MSTVSAVSEPGGASGRRGVARAAAAGGGRARRLLALHTALVYGFLYLPIVVLMVFSFNGAPPAPAAIGAAGGGLTAVWEGFTFAWYSRLLHDALLLGAVRNSLLVGAAATAAAVALGTPVALALARYDFHGRRATQALLLLPVIIPEVVVGAALLTFFGAVALRLSLATVVAAHVVFSIPYVALVVRARLAGVDADLEEAARDLGAGPWETFRRVTLPLALPGILAAALLVFTLSIDDYVITSFVAGVGATTLPLYIYSLLKVGVTPEINAVSTLLLAATIVSIAVAQRLLQRPVGGGGRRAGRTRRRQAE